MEDLKTEEPQQRIQRILETISTKTNAIVKAAQPFFCRDNLTEAYTMVYDRCVVKPSQSQKMLNYFKQLLSDHLAKASRIMIDPSYIKEFNHIHDSFMLYAQLLSRRVFSYLDRYYLPSRDIGSLMRIAVGIFYQNQIAPDDKRRNLLNCFTITLGEYRSNLLLTDNELFKFSINIVKLNQDFYEQIKSAYFRDSQVFYRVKFEQSKDLPPAQFYPRTYNLSLFEETIATKCFLWNAANPNDRQELKHLFVKEIIDPYSQIVCRHPQGLDWCLKFQKYFILNSIIDVATKFESLTKIKERYYEYVKEETTSLIKSLQLQKDEGKIISILCFFFETHNNTLINGFKKNRELQVTLSNAFEAILGKWQRYSSILFEYCKFVVNKGEFEEKSSKIKVVFQKLVNKDQFIHLCQKWLEDILFSQHCDFTEILPFFDFIHELCGSQSTTRLQNIIKDYTNENQIILSELLRVKIISFYLWQRRFKNELAIDLKLPSSLDLLWKAFENQHSEMNAKKKLILLPLTSTLLLGMKFKQKEVLIRCNLLQGCLLMSLVQKHKTAEELQQQINAEKHLLESFIQLFKFIVFKQGVYEIDWQSEVPENMDLTVHLKDNNKFTKAIEQDRSILLEAAIVKVVKRRKQVSFEDIFVYLMESIKMFKPQPVVVKGTIEKLIKKDYIQQSQQGLYVYQQ